MRGVAANVSCRSGSHTLGGAASRKSRSRIALNRFTNVRDGIGCPAEIGTTGPLCLQLGCWPSEE